MADETLPPCYAADGKTLVYDPARMTAGPLMVRAVDFNGLYHEAQRLRAEVAALRSLLDEIAGPVRDGAAHLSGYSWRGNHYIRKPDLYAIADRIDAARAAGEKT